MLGVKRVEMIQVQALRRCGAVIDQHPIALPGVSIGDFGERQPYQIQRLQLHGGIVGVAFTAAEPGRGVRAGFELQIERQCGVAVWRRRGRRKRIAAAGQTQQRHMRDAGGKRRGAEVPHWLPGRIVTEQGHAELVILHFHAQHAAVGAGCVTVGAPPEAGFRRDRCSIRRAAIDQCERAQFRLCLRAVGRIETHPIYAGRQCGLIQCQGWIQFDREWHRPVRAQAKHGARVDTQIAAVEGDVFQGRRALRRPFASDCQGPVGGRALYGILHPDRVCGDTAIGLLRERARRQPQQGEGGPAANRCAGNSGVHRRAFFASLSVLEVYRIMAGPFISR